MSTDNLDGTGRLTVRIEDPELGAAIEEAGKELGSKSEAVRSALRDTMLGSGGVDVGVVAGRKVPKKAVEGHRKLIEYTGVGGRLELDAAESILANHLNIQKEAVRSVVIKPLRGTGVIGISQGIGQVTLVVGDEEEPANDEGWARLQALREYHTAGEKVEETATDGGEVREQLDELAAAGEEVANE